jgi:mitochondrial fission protein ELM1
MVFCTQDSLSMLSEAVAADLPTYALVPADYAAEEFAHSDYARYTHSLVERHLIRRMPLAALAAVDPATDLVEYFKRPARPPLEALADLLAARVLPVLGPDRA